MEKNKKKTCAICQFYTYEKYVGDYVCHKEDSEYFGDNLENNEKFVCNNFTPHLYDLELKEALRIVTTAMRGSLYNYKLPEGSIRPNIVIIFDTNGELESWRDALFRLFCEYIDMMEDENDHITK